MKYLIKYFLLISFYTLHLYSNAQTIEEKWHICLSGSEWDEGKGLIQANDTYWAVGHTESNDGNISYNHGAWDIWLVNVDNAGNLITEKTFGGSNLDGGYVDIKKLNDTIFYIVARSKSSDGDISFNPWPGPLGNYWVIQINNLGEIIWEKVLGGSGKEQMRDAAITDDGGIIVLGVSTSDDGDISNNYGDFDMWMVKLNQDGVKQWDMSLGGTGFEGGGSIKQTSDGGYIIVGATDGVGGGNFDTTTNHHSIHYMDTWVVKLDSLRNIEWQQCYGGYYHDGGANILEIDDGYIVLSSTNSNDGDVSGFHGIAGNGATGNDIWVIKINLVGDIIWQNCLGGSYNDFARNIFTTSDDGYMIVGSTGSKDGDVVGYNGVTTGIYEDVWMAKLTDDGELTWQYCYGGGGREDIYRGVIQKSDYNYVMTIGTDTDEWQCNGQMWPSLRVFELGDSTTGMPIIKQGEVVAVYPNPVSSELIIDYSQLNNNSITTIEVFDSYGRQIYSTKVSKGTQQTTINVVGWTKGLYIVRIMDLGKVVGRRKIIVD